MNYIIIIIIIIIIQELIILLNHVFLTIFLLRPKKSRQKRESRPSSHKYIQGALGDICQMTEAIVYIKLIFNKHKFKKE